ncbi:MAG: CAP domain-containing protein [Methanoregula sp.]|nr:CAP domain-containing protein [Methanoregula sp.]
MANRRFFHQSRKSKRRQNNWWIVGVFALIFIAIYFNIFAINSNVVEKIVQDSRQSINSMGNEISNNMASFSIISPQSPSNPNTNAHSASGIGQTTKAEVTETPRIQIPIFQSFTSIDESKKDLDYINSIRKTDGVSSLRFDSRVYEIAIARVNDMDTYGYMDHTNPKTGSCADSIKIQYGLSSREYVAENAFGFDSSGHYSNGLEKQAIDSWMTSRGHRFNLLYPHSAGAVACSQGGHCVFLGLNNDRFGEGCSTGAQGLAYWDRVGKQPFEK